MQPSTYIPTWRRLAVEQRSSAFKRMQGTRIHSTPKSSRRTARIRITPGGETDCILRSVPRTGRTSSVRLFSCSTDGAVQHTIKGKGPDRSGPSRSVSKSCTENNRIPVGSQSCERAAIKWFLLTKVSSCRRILTAGRQGSVAVTSDWHFFTALPPSVPALNSCLPSIFGG